MELLSFKKDTFEICTDKTKIDAIAVHDFLSNHSYWAKNIPLETVQKAIENSLCFGVYQNSIQIGFARVITDFSTIGYLGDVYILNEFRGKGLSKWLMKTIMSHPDLQGLRRWILLTADAHELYKQYGWKEIQRPERYMEIFNSEVYSSNS
ncbi:GNAT family N-acetyltransferase [Flavobacterium sp. SM15]|uniref:GNAT family N-acetyltransferase n=1 Tax=Flavobacterium sp. SM15 TaxID=2908005 RepID=UPI001EDB2458|nr:GNAT family N-acetyltransferase [Flavobacterium sp. SM15]MCG2612065.1 GNAT family N-acetyltransferase [Flavobacterium sp. SM15]